MRYIIKYTKEKDIKFISHLDLMRTIQRMIKRSGLPVEYSKGFNPHMELSIAQPLSVGMYSVGEYLDVSFLEDLEESYILESLNKSTPVGIKILKVVKIGEDIKNEKKFPKTMALIDAAGYHIEIKYKNAEKLPRELEDLLKKQRWLTVKKSKNGENEVDIKKLVHSFKYKINTNFLEIDTIIACGSRENLSSHQLADYIKENTSDCIEEAFVVIRREEMYKDFNKKLVPLQDILRCY